MAERSDLTLVLGGARSGKSDFAEQLVSKFKTIDYIATAELVDDDMAQRVAEHQSRRPDTWKTVEPSDLALPQAICASRAEAILVDSMTLYVSRAMEREANPTTHMLQVIKEVTRSGSEVFVVSDEVGLSVVPESAEGRRFRDLLGWVNQLLASAADRVYLVVAGIPVVIKEGGTS